MESIKEVNITNRTYYFFNGMINIINSDSDLLKVDKKSYKNIDIYYIGYITIKDLDCVNIYSINPLYFIIDKVGEYIEESNGNKYLVFASTDKNKELLTKIWNKIKNLIEKIYVKPSGYGKDFMKIRFD